MEYPENQEHSRRAKVHGLQEHIAQVYYKHGLLCSSHPVAFIIVTLIITMICCYPLLNVPVLSSAYQKFSVPLQDHIQHNSLPSSNFEQDVQEVIGPRWFQGAPVAYIQQIIIKSAVTPWSESLVLMDAIRSPLNEVFDVVELVSNHQTVLQNSESVSLTDLCLQVEEPVDKLASAVLPRYGCLVVSPANIWRSDKTRFQQDDMILKSIYSLKDATSDSVTLKDVLFGVPWRETGIKRLYVRRRQRVLTYAITIVFKDFNYWFLDSLEKTLGVRYPRSTYPENATRVWSEESIFHLHFEAQYTWAEFIPLGVAYVMLFLYIYFSFRKMDLVKSKWALAVSSVITVVMSLFNSVGLCLWFGLNLTLNGSEVLPYLVVIVGLENMLVLTKSVVSTPAHLDVKVRVAQGLSKEGWSITKNLFTELALLTFAFFTFVPVIQEFCLIAAVGVLSDFFLQLSFFATMLSFDIHRSESEEHQRETVDTPPNFGSSRDEDSHAITSNFQKDLHTSSGLLRTRIGSQRMRSPVVPYGNSRYPSTVFASSSTPILVKLPKRLRFIYFWARTRMVQKGLMVCLVVWISLLLYKSGIVEHLADNTTHLLPTVLKEQVMNPLRNAFSWGKKNFSGVGFSSEDDTPVTSETGSLDTDRTTDMEASKLLHHNLELWEGIPSQHLLALFGYYNISLQGKFLSVLPSMHISIPVHLKTAVENRHQTEADINLKSSGEVEIDVEDTSEASYHPSSPSEVGLALALAIPSIVCIVYILILLYRCMCSRHYAEWRSSWWQKQVGFGHARGGITSYMETEAHLIMESIPIKLQGHKREVEHMTSDGNFVLSACLSGNLCMWDPLTGECIAMVQRSRPRNKVLSKPKYQTHRPTDSMSSDSNYSSSPTSDIGDHIPLAHPGFSMPSTTSFPSQSASSSSSHVCKRNEAAGYDFSHFVQLRKEGTAPESKGGGESQGLLEEMPAPPSDIETASLMDNPRSCVSPLPYQPIWCLDSQGSLCVVGCSQGRIEVWDVGAAKLLCCYSETPVGITSLRIIGSRIVVARINGVLEFFQLQVSTDSTPHSDTCSEHLVDRSKVSQSLYIDVPKEDWKRDQQVKCVWLNNLRAHSQPISVLEVSEGHVVTGSLDHLVKVFRCDSAPSVYTLHGHYGGITAIHIDQTSSTTNAVSGCQGGVVCVWDLMTGTCVFNLDSHQGAVTAVLATEVYVISSGDDNYIRIREKYQGHLLNTLRQHHTFFTGMILLTKNIIVTANNDSLFLWDVNCGEPLKMLSLGSGDQNAHIKNLRKVGHAVVCDCGKCLYVIHFPAVTEKKE